MARDRQPIPRLLERVAQPVGGRADVGRDPEEITITALGPTVHARTGAELNALIEYLRPQNQSAESYAAALNAGTTDEQIARYRRLAALGMRV